MGRNVGFVCYWDRVERSVERGIAASGVGGVVGCLVALASGGRWQPCIAGVACAVAAAAVAVVTYLVRASMKLSSAGRGVLISGCDTGFGHSLARHLDGMGFTVFAGVLDVSAPGAASLRRRASARLHVIPLDVTSEQQVEQAVAYVKKHAPEKGLWGLVNNAGCASYGEVEWVSIGTYRKTLDINLLGTIRLCQAFLPNLRASKGRVVNMASGLARMAVPMRSAYVASKYAVAGFTECLRLEMKSWGVHVSVIEPGNYISGTNIFTRAGIEEQAEAMWSSLAAQVKQDYGKEHFDVRVAQMKGYSDGGMHDVSPVVEAFTAGLVDRYPQVRYQPMDLYFKIRCFVATHLPICIYDALYVETLLRHH